MTRAEFEAHIQAKEELATAINTADQFPDREFWQALDSDQRPIAVAVFMLDLTSRLDSRGYAKLADFLRTY